MSSPYFLDTNILLAATIAPERLPAEVADMLCDSRNEVYFSKTGTDQNGAKLSGSAYDVAAKSVAPGWMALT